MTLWPSGAVTVDQRFKLCRFSCRWANSLPLHASFESSNGLLRAGLEDSPSALGKELWATIEVAMTFSAMNLCKDSVSARSHTEGAGQLLEFSAMTPSAAQRDVFEVYQRLEVVFRCEATPADHSLERGRAPSSLRSSRAC